MSETPDTIQTHAEAFTFGDPVSMLDKREILNYIECVPMSRWYEPPISPEGWHVLSAPVCIMQAHYC